MPAGSMECEPILLIAFALAALAYVERRPADFPSAIGTGETGSGFVIASDARQSFIVTAAHVLGCDSYGGGCDEEVDLRFADDPANVWRAKRAYSGSALTNEDVAVLVVPRGGLPAFSLSTPVVGSRVHVVGFPESLVASARQSPSSLRPRALAGTMGVALRDERVSLALSSEGGESGAPVLDEAGNAVAVLQGRLDRSHDIAVAGAPLHDLVSLIALAVTTSSKDAAPDAPERERAYLLTRNARYWEALRARYYGIEGQRELQQTEDVDFGDAVAAGSLDAARWFLRLYSARGGIYQPSTRVARAALRMARAAADAGDAGAAYDVHTFLQGLVNGPKSDATAEAERLSAEYYKRALTARYPFALLEEAGKTPLDQAVFEPLQLEAMPGLKKLADEGDAEAAYAYANIYADQPRPPSLAVSDPVTPENYLRAIELGSHASLPQLLIYRNQLPDPAVALTVARDEALKDWSSARELADLYADGKSVQRDPIRALDLYALSYISESFQAKLNALAPGVADAFAGIKSSAAFTAARNAISFVASSDVNDSGYGVSLASDAHHTVVAIPSALLHCDAFEKNCRVPLFVRFDGIGDAKNYTPSIAYQSGNTLEFGIALLDVPVGNKPAVHVVENPGPLLFTFNREFLSPKDLDAFVGILRGVDENGHVVRCDVPWAELGGPKAVFDMRSGDLVGFATDPVDLAHIMGPAAIRDALSAPTERSDPPVRL